MKLNNWACVSVTSDPYKAPEQGIQCLNGEVLEHPNFKDGKVITTSKIMGKRNNKVVTYSGSEYELMAPREDYEKIFPNSKQRMMDSLPEV